MNIAAPPERLSKSPLGEFTYRLIIQGLVIASSIKQYKSVNGAAASGAYPTGSVSLMPQINAGGLQNYVDRAMETIKSDTVFGPENDKNDGDPIPVVVYPEGSPLGYTAFEKGASGLKPVEVGISASALKTDKELDRVLEHELRHVRYADIVSILEEYNDVSDVLLNAIAEGVPEYAAIASDPDNADYILSTTPYGKELELVMDIDAHYKNGNSEGFAAFMEDVKGHKSLRYGMDRFLDIMSQKE